MGKWFGQGRGRGHLTATLLSMKITTDLHDFSADLYHLPVGMICSKLHVMNRVTKMELLNVGPL